MDSTAESSIKGSHDASTPQDTRASRVVSMTPEMFERLYLSPPTKVAGNLRKTFANPTPIGLIGFLMCLTPLSCNLMGWRGANGSGAAHIPVYFFMGGVQMIIASVLEWILGNSFPSIVFITFGTFWLSFAGTLSPSFAAFSSYAPADASSPAEGLASQGFNASLGFWLLWFNIVCVIFFICSLRTNVVFVVLFFSLIISVGLLNGAYWLNAEDIIGNADAASRLFVAAGAAGFVTSLCGWYLLTSAMLAIVDFPLTLPVGDLTGIVKGKSQRDARI